MDADFRGASLFALRRLQDGLPPGLHYHDVRHTRDVVVPAAAALSRREGLSAEDSMLVLTAAWFHDLGFAETRLGHEAVGARLASEVLPGLGYRPGQVARVCATILATAMPQAPQDRLGMVLADADLDTLGSPDFPVWSGRLRRELAATGEVHSDAGWWQAQRDVLLRHAYFTPAARARRDGGKRRNLDRLARRLAGLRARAPGD